jgi:two-component system response regulator FixJ
VSDATVAVIDDHPDGRNALTLLLRIEGFKVTAYASPAPFLADATARHSCLIVDQNLPGMTGLELVSILRDQGNDVPVLLMSGAIDGAIAKRATELNVQKVMEKPLEPDDVLAFVEIYRRDCPS